MKLQLHYLSQHLGTKALKKIYLLLGEESFLLMQTEKDIIKTAKKLGFLDIMRISLDSKSSLDALEQEFYAGSLFAFALRI
jgi:DNA polymerase III delta subunit